MGRIFDIFEFFEIHNFYQSGQLLVSTCPVHDGDNFSAFNINIDESSDFYGIWFCNTKKCHESCGRDILALIQVLLSKNTKEKCSFKDVVVFLEKFCKNKKKPRRTQKIVKRTAREINKSHTREHIRKYLSIPAQEYIDRGFKEETINEFDVGLCSIAGSEMVNRVVFPVYDESDSFMVGCVGRTVTDHEFRWKNQKGFNVTNYLYNHGRAIDIITESSTVIVVEGQGGVLRLWESGIKNVVGLFGSRMSDTQEFLIQKMGVDNIIIITDNDKAGERCREDIRDRFEGQLNIYDIRSTKNDIEDMSIEEIQRTIKKEIEEIINE